MKLKPDDKGIYVLKKLAKLGKILDNNSIEVKKPKIIAKGVVVDHTITEVDIRTDKEGEKFIKKLLGEIDYVEEKDLTGTGVTIDDLKTNNYDGLFFDRKEFIKRKKLLTGLVKNSDFVKPLENGFVNKEITLSFNPVIKQLTGNENHTEFNNFYGGKGSFYLPTKDTKDDVDFNDGQNKLVGRFYRNRNTIVIFAIPWKDTNKLAEFIISRLKIAKPKTEDVEKFKLVSLAKIFTKDIVKRVTDKEKSIESKRNDLISYQNSIMEHIRNIEMTETEIGALKGMQTNFKGSFFKEMQEVKDVKIVDSVELTPTEVKVKFKPTCITKAQYTRSYVKFGKRSFYVGSVILKISAGDLLVTNDLKLETYKTTSDPNSGVSSTNPHPHVRNEGACCLGKEATKNTLYSLKNQCKIADLSLYFWSFVKTYGTDGGFMSPTCLYDFCLMHGYPVFDEKGNHIYINDEQRIKDKEQIKLKKAKDWDENVEKFKNFNPA